MNILIKELENHEEYKELVNIPTTSIEKDVEMYLNLTNMKCEDFLIRKYENPNYNPISNYFKVFVALFDYKPVGISSYGYYYIGMFLCPVIQFIITDEPFRNKKIGTFLIGKMMNDIFENPNLYEDQNSKRLWVQTNTAKDFYLKNGFKLRSKKIDEKLGTPFDICKNEILTKELSIIQKN